MTNGVRWAVTLLILIGGTAILSPFMAESTAFIAAGAGAVIAFLVLPAKKKA